MLEYQQQIENSFNQSIEKEIVENLQELRNGEFGIPKECKNLFKQAYETLKSVEILQASNLLVDCCSLLRTCMENIITTTMIAINDEFYEEFKNLTLKDGERKFTLQSTRNLFRKELKKMESQLFDEVSNGMLQSMLDEMYNKLCKFTHSSPVVNLAVEMCEDGSEDILNYTVIMILQFLKLLLNCCMKHLTKRESKVDYSEWAILTMLYFVNINAEKYKDGRLEKYKELIDFSKNEGLYVSEQKNINRLKKEKEMFLKMVQENPKEFEMFIRQIYENSGGDEIV